MKEIYLDNSIKGINDEIFKRKDKRKEIENELYILLDKKPELKEIFKFDFKDIFNAYKNPSKIKFKLKDNKEIVLFDLSDEEEKGIELDEDITITRIQKILSGEYKGNKIIKKRNITKKNKKIKDVKKTGN